MIEACQLVLQQTIIDTRLLHALARWKGVLRVSYGDYFTIKGEQRCEEQEVRSWGATMRLSWLSETLETG